MTSFIYGLTIATIICTAWVINHPQRVITEMVYIEKEITQKQLVDRLSLHLDGKHNFIWIDPRSIPKPKRKPVRG